MTNTITYYNANASDFIAGAVSIDFETMQKRFTDKLLSNAYILDFGCGSGRDTKYFLEHGFQVDAIDGSEELCRLASVYTGIPVKHAYFQELNETEKYDGIWACASILHLSRAELPGVIQKMVRALKENGVIYTSFKYGDFEGERNGRYFTYMTETSLADLLRDVHEIEVEEQWITTDVRPDREDEQWLNLILRKRYFKAFK